MYLIKSYFVAFFLIIVMSQPALAADSNCSFFKKVKQGQTTFDIGSRPAYGCGVQIITVTARRGGKKIAGYKTDIDYLAQSAKAVNLIGDSRPQLAIISRATGGALTEVMDVYWLDGTTLQRSTVPELDNKVGYKGGDRYNLEGRLVVRTVPVYLDGDPVGKPTGGTRSLKYELKGGAFALYDRMEKAANLSVESAAQNAAPPESAQPAVSVQPAAVSVQPIEVRATAPAAAGLDITQITASESGIEIRAGGPIENFKTMKLENPERIAVDLPGAASKLVGKKIKIDKFGISTVRVGRNKGFLRVVLDTKLGKFPKYQVKPSGTGLLIEFTK